MKSAAQFFRVLGDEARLNMLWLLLNHEELCVCDIMEVLEITQSKASRHLRTLLHAGLVIDRKDGLWSFYRLRPVEDDFVRQHFKLLRRTLATSPEASSVLKRLNVWLANNRTVPVPPKPQTRGKRRP